MNREQSGFNIDLSKTTPIICEACGNNSFNSVFHIRKLSALVSPSGQETIIPVQAFACAECKHINQDFLPQNEKSE